MSSLKDKVCLVTGAGSGIGRATVEMMLSEGAKVCAFSRSAEPLASLAAAHPGAPLVTFAGDVSDETSVKAAFAACLAELGPVEVLINNAGLGTPTPDLATTDVAILDEMFDVNVRGVFLCTREALPAMKAKGDGHIMTVISMGGQRTNPVAPLYCASKFAARGFNSGLHDQVIKAGIKVTDLNPGPVDTNYWGDRQVPRDKFLQPADVANIIRFILSLPADVLVREINFDNMKFLQK